MQPITYPNLYTEATDMTIASILIFAMADLRRLARKGVLNQQSEQALVLPISVVVVREIIQANKEVARSQVRSNEFFAVDFLLQHYFATEENARLLEGATIHAFGDDKATEECVYGISSNSVRQTVTLAFRGSITIRDWRTDATMICGEIRNPLVDLDDDDGSQPEQLGVHLGFRDYLYADAPPSVLPAPLQKLQKKISDRIPNVISSGGSEKEQKKNKLDVILDEIEQLLEQNPGYRLIVTGHSLGGALSLLASLEAAVRFGKKGCPVTCVAVANPRAGDARFRAAIQALEQKGLLRCLVVHNNLDLVPMQPARLCHCGKISNREFCQQGMQLTLLSKQHFKTHYHGGNETSWEHVGRKLKHLWINLTCWVRMAQQHNYREYLDRLMALEGKLSKLYLNDLYKKENIEF